MVCVWDEVIVVRGEGGLNMVEMKILKIFCNSLTNSNLRHTLRTLSKLSHTLKILLKTLSLTNQHTLNQKYSPYTQTLKS